MSDEETDAGRVTACEDLEPALALTVDGAAQTLTLTEAGLTFPPGVGGLSTMRIVCGFSAATGPLARAARIDYADTSFSDRLGWREIVVEGSAMTLARRPRGALRTESVSARLTAYPTNLLTQALADIQVAIVATPGGPTLPRFDIPDASPLPGAGQVATSSAPPPAGSGGARRGSRGHPDRRARDRPPWSRAA